MKNILIATDLSAQSCFALDRAVSLAKQLGAKLHITHSTYDRLLPDADAERESHAHTEESSIKEHLECHHDLDNIDFEIHIQKGSPNAAITKLAAKINADLVVLGLHNNSEHHLKEFFFGTMTEQIIPKVTSAILVVKNDPTHDYKKILVATDYSDASLEALQMALNISTKPELDIMHACGTMALRRGREIDDMGKSVVKKFDRSHLDDFIKHRSNDYISKQDSEHQPKSITPTLLEGDTYSCIMQETQKFYPDLLAFGTEGVSDFIPAIFSGDLHKILVNPPCDVLISHNPAAAH